LAAVDPRTEAGLRGATKLDKAELKGKIVEFIWWMKKEGYAEPTIRSRARLLKLLVKRGADLKDPETVKQVVAKQSGWSDGTKKNAIDAYTCFLAMNGLTWNPPRYRISPKLPFIPLEKELDELIISCGKKMGAFLQGLKETGADPGELWRAEWTDVDFEKKIIRINHPVKGHNPRILPISDRWINMLSRLPKKDKRIFGGTTRRSFDASFRTQRRRAAAKLGNPRILKITFTTFRHWKGTMEYHKTKDILHVKRILGHKRIESTMIYINLEQALFQNENEEFTVRVAHSLKEACELVEAGFEYVTDMEGAKIFRRRK